MLVYHHAPIGKVVRCSLIITLLHGRLLDVRLSQFSHRKVCLMFVYHCVPTGKVVTC